MKRTIEILSICFSLLIMLISCEKDINIKQKPYNSKLSIECLITPGTFPKLYLNNTLPYLNAAVSPKKMFVADAKVTIETNGITDQMVPDSAFQVFFGTYNYFYKGSKLILPNQTYYLTILSKGISYIASATTNQHPVKLDSVTYVKAFKDVYGEHEGVVLHLKDDPAAINYYRFEMHRLADTATYWGEDKFKSPILKNDETTRVTEIGRTIYSDASFSGGDFSFAIEPVFKHRKDLPTYVRLQTCDKNMFDFYNELDQQMLSIKNPFVEPIFLLPKQYKNAIGVFGSYAVSDSVLFVYPE